MKLSNNQELWICIPALFLGMLVTSFFRGMTTVEAVFFGSLIGAVMFSDKGISLRLMMGVILCGLIGLFFSHRQSNLYIFLGGLGFTILVYIRAKKVRSRQPSDNTNKP